ncbi:MAG: hypothetical protein KBD37_06720 [Burkholderiales bacterium]|nr:hypothetical protein [Burkholderiales bacterium]
MAVDKIRGISRNENIGRIEGTSRSVDINNVEYVFREHFDFSEIPFDGEMRGEETEIELLIQILLALFQDIVLDGCQIIPRGALVSGQKRIEASFKPPANKKTKPTIYVPLPDIAQSIDAIDHTLTWQRQRVLNEIAMLVDLLSKRLTNYDLIKLIVLMSHEYGHYISYRNGNHTTELRRGLSLLHSNSPFKNENDRYAFQVFSEEATAWRIAEEKLTAYKFAWWNILEGIKYSSLKFYYKCLNLENASIDTYCRLSMLGVDLTKVSVAKSSASNIILQQNIMR